MYRVEDSRNGVRYVINEEKDIVAVNRQLRYDPNDAEKAERYLTDNLKFKKIDERHEKGTITPYTRHLRKKRDENRKHGDVGAVASSLIETVDSAESGYQKILGIFDRVGYDATMKVFEDKDGGLAYLIYNDQLDKSPGRYGYAASLLAADALAYIYDKELMAAIEENVRDFVMHNVPEISELVPFAKWVPFAVLGYLTATRALPALADRVDKKRMHDSFDSLKMTKDEIVFGSEIPRGITVIIKKPGYGEKNYKKVRDELVETIMIENGAKRALTELYEIVKS